jgi:formylglycine-generating enzyme required for sulfatase activity
MSRHALLAVVLAAVPVAPHSAEPYVEPPPTWPGGAERTPPVAATATPAPSPVAANGGMVLLEGGSFRAAALGGPANDTVVYERVLPFLLDVTEVTVAAYDACVWAGACTPAMGVQWTNLGDSDRQAWAAQCNGGRFERRDHPVNCVDAHQAETYCRWAAKRLPTEGEWEWAARAGRQGTIYPWGNAAPGSRPCWNGPGNDAGPGGRASTCVVGSHPAANSPAGVKDLAGNVWEWTSSRAQFGGDSRGIGPTGRVARGGGWYDSTPDALSTLPKFVDVATRKDPTVGFRCALTLWPAR